MTEEASGQGNTDTTGDQATGAAGGEDNSLNGGDQASAEAADAGEAGDSTDGNGEGDGAGDEAPAAEVPETYEFSLPDGATLDEGLAESVTPLFKEFGLTQDQANRLVEAYAGSVSASDEAVQAAYQQQLDDWKTELVNDPSFGGDNFEQNLGTAAKALDAFGSEALKEALNTSGFGGHPEMVKFMFAVGKLVGEDQPGSGDAATEAGTPEARLYPNEARRA